MKIVIIQDLGINEDEVRKTFDEILHTHSLTYYNSPPKNQEDLLNKVKDSEVIVTVNYPIKEETIEKCGKLKHIAISFTGMDHVDVEFAKSRGINVTNVSGYATQSVAELALANIINALRKIPYENQRMANGEWKGSPGRTLEGKTVGIIGLGTIGKRLCELLKPFNCKIIGTSRRNVSFCKVVELKTLLRESDIIVLCVALTDETKYIINRNTLELMKDNTILVNVARGPIVNENDIMNSKIIYVSDVFEKEPLTENNLLRKNKYSTPHIAYYTEEALHKKVIMTFENIKNNLIKNN